MTNVYNEVLIPKFQKKSYRILHEQSNFRNLFYDNFFTLLRWVFILHVLNAKAL